MTCVPAIQECEFCYRCFNTLDLPKYKTKDQLAKMLQLSIEYGMASEFINE